MDDRKRAFSSMNLEMIAVTSAFCVFANAAERSAVSLSVFCAELCCCPAVVLSSKLAASTASLVRADTAS